MATYKLISSTTLSSSQSTITFSSIPSTYTDLVIKASTRDSSLSNAGAIAMRFNSSTTNYNGRIIYSDGSTATGSFLSGLYYGWAGTVNNANYTANTFSNHEIYIPSYNSSTAKPYSVSSVVETNANLAEYLVSTAGLWNGSEITSIVLTVSNGSSFASGSSFDLYGIENVDVIAKATGGTITSDGTYVYHTFTSSGTFTPKQSLTADYLVVAGGGAGGGGPNEGTGGGGGAGGLRCTVDATGGGGSLESPLSLTAQAYTVTIGAGGAVTSSNTSAGGSGSNSVFATITSTGGGGGGSTYNNTPYGPSTGGSGGGGGGRAEVAGASGTANQGRAGGAGSTVLDNAAGGGGGAGAVGGAGQSRGPGAGNTPGSGGNGVTTSISGTSTTYAGGGGGGTDEGGSNQSSGGSGGGGAGGLQSNPAVAGTVNRGGGGGGMGNTTGVAAAGGSGIVIVRYAI